MAVRRFAISSLATLLLAVTQAPSIPSVDHRRDFDFEFGAWKAHVHRLQHPLKGSHVWLDYDGTSVVRKVWSGRANLGELEVQSAAGRIEGLSLRLYDPGTQLWSIYFANGRDGSLGYPPMVGRFQNGRGIFYDRESFAGKSIAVRFVFSGVTATSFRFEQSFSADSGKTWEPNWIATFER